MRKSKWDFHNGTFGDFKKDLVVGIPLGILLGVVGVALAVLASS